MTQTTPHPLARYYTPDEIAEAVAGISAPTYARLWALASAMPAAPESEWPEPVEQEQSVVAVWASLSEAQQREINDAIEAQARQDALDELD